MAINALAMNNNNQEEGEEGSICKQAADDEHEHDVVMPGFRFHPTEEELVEFYLRRKVEGRRFNVELITFLDLYRYDPWELPALAAIGEKEWYFYVPRDRKYRNGDRPNRVTTSGYWKATGADRMIRSENHHRNIGLKKTLVFYSGKAPKGIRTSWIMNEYRLPHHETERLQKAEISLCRVYKRAGVEDHPSLPRCTIPTKATSSSSSRGSQSTRKQQNNDSSSNNNGKLNEITSPVSITTTADIATSLALSHQITNINNNINNPLLLISPDIIFSGSSSSGAANNINIDELHKLVNINNINNRQYNNSNGNSNNIGVPNLLSQFQEGGPPPPLNLAGSASFSDRLWDWSAINNEASKDYANLFK
ncbi:hypothetical protein ABFS83_02G080200 [Erythranthe nasuta]